MPDGQALYRRRRQIVEPVFAHTKCIRRSNRFLRRSLAAWQAEWQLIATTHNLLKLWRAGLAQAATAIGAAGRLRGTRRPRQLTDQTRRSRPLQPPAIETPARRLCATASLAGLSE
jgi:hypothetical protein